MPKGRDESRFDWVGWEAETDLGVHFLTIRDDDEEIAVIIHRTPDGKYPSDPIAEGKIRTADRIVRALWETYGDDR